MISYVFCTPFIRMVSDNRNTMDSAISTESLMTKMADMENVIGKQIMGHD